MKPLTLEELAAEADDFDRLVLQTPDVDHFCSSSSWVLPAAQALMPARQPWIWRGEAGTIAMMRGTHDEGWDYLEPLEAMWTLGSPLLGPDPVAIADAFAAQVRRLEREWDLILLGGLDSQRAAFRHLVTALGTRYRLRLGRSMKRHVASLEGGLDGFLSRRARKFRQNLRRAWKQAEPLGLTFERADDPQADPAALYRRIQAVEARSWKGRARQGINVGGMRDFYDHMLRRLVPRGMLRLIFARHEGRDVGYVFGAVMGDAFRGLQFSYDDSLQDASLGNLMQMTMIETMIDEGMAWYDLGSDIDYKRHWGETGLKTSTLVVFR